MGKSKKSKGKKGKGKKKDKKPKEPEEPPPPPELNTFVSIRRKNLTLCLETFEEQQIKELKVQVATILRQFPEDIQLFAMTGKKEEEMLEKEKPKKEEKKKEDKSKSRGGGRDKKEEKKKEKREEPKPPADMTLAGYGYTAATSTIFKPLTIGLSYRGDDAEFEKLDITPYGEFPVIPESIKMHLRNYEPPPPPPTKKGNNNKGNNNKGKSK